MREGQPGAGIRAATKSPVSASYLGRLLLATSRERGAPLESIDGICLKIDTDFKMERAVLRWVAVPRKAHVQSTGRMHTYFERLNIRHNCMRVNASV